MKTKKPIATWLEQLATGLALLTLGAILGYSLQLNSTDEASKRPNYETSYYDHTTGKWLVLTIVERENPIYTAQNN